MGEQYFSSEYHTIVLGLLLGLSVMFLTFIINFFVINFRVLVLNVFDTLCIKIKSYHTIFKYHSGLADTFTSPFGGNQIDGLLPAFNFEGWPDWLWTRIFE